MPFERLVQELDPDRDPSRSPLFQVMFVLQNAPTEGVRLEGLERRGIGAGRASAKFDLTFTLADGAGGLTGAMEFATDLFDGATIERMLGALGILLEGIARRPEAKLWELPLLSEAEIRRAIAVGNGPGAEFPPHACLHELFEAWVDQSPAAPAVSFEGKHLSYRELDERANRLAHALVERGVGPEVLVAVAKSSDTPSPFSYISPSRYIASVRPFFAASSYQRFASVRSLPIPDPEW